MNPILYSLIGKRFQKDLQAACPCAPQKDKRLTNVSYSQATENRTQNSTVFEAPHALPLKGTFRYKLQLNFVIK